MRGSPHVLLTFEVDLLDGLSHALLFALEVGDAGVLELEPVLLVALQGQSLGPGSTTQVKPSGFHGAQCLCVVCCSLSAASHP